MSTKPISQKMFIKEGYHVLLINEPEGYREILGDLPKDVTFSTNPEGEFEFIHVFVKSLKELTKHLKIITPLLKSKGLLWVSYPKGTSKLKVDINRDVIWEYVKTLGMSAVSMISIDKTWSAMRLKIEE
jgi:hypothetical protein